VSSPLAGGLGSLLAAVRGKLRVAIASVAVIWMAAFFFAERITVLLAQPLVDAWSRRAAEEGLGRVALHFGSLLEPFWTFMSLSFWVAIVVASPVLFFQLWKALAPRLAERHRRLGVPFAGLTGLFFIAGVVFGYLFVMPLAFDFLLSYSEQNLAAMHEAAGLSGPLALRPALFIEPYLRLTIRMLLAFGLAFELPVLLGLLSWLGLVSHRGLWRFNRWAVVVAFAIAALLTPGPDVVSQVLMALPLVALYNLSILVAWLIGRRRAAAGGG
jgi:sec-independent protein translocase protein TatC